MQSPDDTQWGGGGSGQNTRGGKRQKWTNKSVFRGTGGSNRGRGQGSHRGGYDIPQGTPAGPRGHRNIRGPAPGRHHPRNSPAPSRNFAPQLSETSFNPVTTPALPQGPLPPDHPYMIEMKELKITRERRRLYWAGVLDAVGDEWENPAAYDRQMWEAEERMADQKFATLSGQIALAERGIDVTGTMKIHSLAPPDPNRNNTGKARESTRPTESRGHVNARRLTRWTQRKNEEAVNNWMDEMGVTPDKFSEDPNCHSQADSSAAGDNEVDQDEENWTQWRHVMDDETVLGIDDSSSMINHVRGSSMLPQKPLESSSVGDRNEPQKPVESSNVQDENGPQKHVGSSNVQDKNQSQKHVGPSSVRDRNEPLDSSNVQDENQPQKSLESSSIQNKNQAQKPLESSSVQNKNQAQKPLESSSVQDRDERASTTNKEALFEEVERQKEDEEEAIFEEAERKREEQRMEMSLEEAERLKEEQRMEMDSLVLNDDLNDEPNDELNDKPNGKPNKDEPDRYEEYFKRQDMALGVSSDEPNNKPNDKPNDKPNNALDRYVEFLKEELNSGGARKVKIRRDLQLNTHKRGSHVNPDGISLTPEHPESPNLKTHTRPGADFQGSVNKEACPTPDLNKIGLFWESLQEKRLQAHKETSQDNLKWPNDLSKSSMPAIEDESMNNSWSVRRSGRVAKLSAKGEQNATVPQQQHNSSTLKQGAQITMSPPVTRSAARASAQTTLTGPSVSSKATVAIPSIEQEDTPKRPAIILQSALERFQGIPRSSSQIRGISSIFQRDAPPANAGTAETESRSIPQKRVRDTSSSPEAERGEPGPITTTNNDNGGFDHIDDVLSESEEDSSVDGTTPPPAAGRSSRSARRGYSSAQLIEALEALPGQGVRGMSFGELWERRERLERALGRAVRYVKAAERGCVLGRERQRLANRVEDAEEALDEVLDWLEQEEEQ
ncbi:hypothetical protein MMC14_002888 [Varicellaria rhodocarpa]|nr:hypothetical protein [Varicellaria rhodocarpa]